MSNGEFDPVEHQSTFELRNKTIGVANVSECDALISEDNLSNVLSNGSDTGNFNAVVLVGEHIHENSWDNLNL